MKPTHIEHIGIAVASLEEAIPFYEKIGFVKLEEEYFEDDIYHLLMKITPCTCKRDCIKS